jgi:diguanylate cyclase (GGDEF)-like protein/PAS domain S-box-containing protein
MPDLNDPVKTSDLKAKSYQEQLLSSNDLTELYASAKRQAQELELLDRVRMMLTRELDPAAVIRNVVEAIADTFHYRLVSIYLLRENVLVMQHQVGYEQVIMEIPISMGIVGKVVRTGQPLLVRNIQTDQDFLEAIKGILSEVCVPLFDREKVVGVLNIETSQGRMLDEADLRLITLLGESVSVALERSRLYSEIRESEGRYRLLFYQTPVGIIHFDRQLHLLDWNNFSLAILQSSQKELNGLDLNKLPDARLLPAIQSALDGEVGQYEGPYEATAGLLAAWISMRTVPLYDQTGQVQGGIGIIEDITDRKKVEDAEHNQRILSEVLRDSAAALNSSLDLEQVFNSILSNIGRVVACDTVDISLTEDHDTEKIIRHRGAVGLFMAGENQSIRFDGTETDHFSHLMERDGPFIISDTQLHPDWVMNKTMIGIRSYAGIPIHLKGKVIGFIDLGSFTPDFYQPEHIERLRAFADQAAIAITNAKLVEELRQTNDLLAENLDKIKSLQAELEEQAVRDPLTGLFNRRYFQETLEREIARAKRENMPVGIIVMDLDRFKQVNDSFGHKAGDIFLKEIGNLLIKNIRREDAACRIGGEEFVIVMPGASIEVTGHRAELIRSLTEALHVADTVAGFNITMSIGISAYPTLGTGGEEILIQADRALYQAKKNGRNQVVVYRPDLQPFQQFIEEAKPATPEEKGQDSSAIIDIISKDQQGYPGDPQKDQGRDHPGNNPSPG